MIFTDKEFIAKLLDVAQNYKTLYVNGCFGAPMTEANKKRYIAHSKYNQKVKPKAAIEAASADTFGMDCICMIKAIFWQWCGDVNHPYGGAIYKSNGVDDMTLDTMLSMCADVSTDFSDIVPGELLWMDGHVGVYIGDGLAVECTPAWKNGVQITAVKNIGSKKGYSGRTWIKHGKLPWIGYEKKEARKTVSIEMEILKRGSEGEHVKTLQRLLDALGYKPGSIDGSFGPKTENTVRAFQEDFYLDIDGSVGPATWSKLLRGE